MEESGWLNVNKPKGWQSTRVVSVIKKITKARKVGHGGTLDKLASGVLPICINKATKQVESMMNHEKRYLFHLTFGELRTTNDEEGEIIEKNDFVPTLEDIKKVLPNFTGIIKQTPPLYSAIKINGKRASDLAREGKNIELKARDILIKDIKINGFIGNNILEFVVDCGRGCYVRSLGVDIAKSVGALGYISKIERQKVGDFLLENSLNIEDDINIERIKECLVIL